jgi:hypothetical protein
MDAQDARCTKGCALRARAQVNQQHGDAAQHTACSQQQRKNSSLDTKCNRIIAQKQFEM